MRTGRMILALAVSALALAAVPSPETRLFEDADGVLTMSLGGEDSCATWKFLGCAGGDPNEYGPWPLRCVATKCWVPRADGDNRFNTFGGIKYCTSTGSAVVGCGSVMRVPFPCDYVPPVDGG